MRKRLITPISQDVRSRDEGWLDLDGVAVVEVTSEEKEYPVHQGIATTRRLPCPEAPSGGRATLGRVGLAITVPGESN